MAHGKGRPGAQKKGKKGPQKGSGGLGRKALEGRGPTPKAEDRPYHPAAKRKSARQRSESGRPAQAKRPATPSGGRNASSAGAEVVTGRNSVLEALRARIPAATLYVATRIDADDRIREILAIASSRGVPMLEVTRPELDRLGGVGSVHQGVAISVPEYDYAHPRDLLEGAFTGGRTPLLVALDGITDPRNLGAIIRSTAAFGGHGVIVPQRRSAGVTASAWKTSAGAAARLPVAKATNLTQTLKEYKKQGVFVIGLDGDGDVDLPDLQLADRPVVIVVGSEGKGLSRLVTETCDVVVSIPISAATESLNAGIAASVTLYDISQRRQV